VLAPTRELALQIGKDANDLSKYMKVHNLVCFGGMDHREQRRALDTPVDILAGTPGRILDYIGSGHLDLSQTEVLVIDEADRMLDMGFIPDVRRIVARLPAPGKRQTLLFSATLDESIMRLAHRWLEDPVKVEIEPEALTTNLVEEIFYSVPDKQKLNLLLWLLENDQVERMLIFGNRKDRTNDLARTLRHHDVRVELLSGDVPQKTRLNVLERFREGTTQVIVATDVAARGIHVDNISHVINWDLPYEPEDYVHRIGRTGRAGETGKAISFADEYGAYIILELEEFVGRQIACLTPGDHMVQPPPKPAARPEDTAGERPPGRRGNRGHGSHRRPRWDNHD
jgi:ATP-dependent RNA helicase RhlB